MIRDKNIAPDASIFPGKIAGFGCGEIFYVCQTANSNVYEWLAARVPSDNLYTTIQAALDATVANRNDYVLVYPDSSDYDITAALTMSKRNVHLICPAGLGFNGFPGNAARIHQNTASTALFTVTGDCIEIAGFFFKGYSGANIITLSSTRWHPHIHDNFFGMSATDGSDNYGIVGTGAVSHYSIHDNYFVNYLPGAMTSTDNDLGSFIYFSSSSCTRGLIRDNIFVSGANTEVTTAILAKGADILIDGNVFLETKALSGVYEDGTFTKGITIDTAGAACRNMFSMDADNEVTGGNANEAYTANYESTSGGTVVT